jgi:protein subunit release factor A
MEKEIRIMKVVLEIRSAEGGDDSKLFVKDLSLAYRKFCDKNG